MKRVSNGLADQDYCLRMEKEVPVTAQYLLEYVCSQLAILFLL